MKTRGYRNNNPGNIRKSTVKYLGEKESNDKSFKCFESPAWGYRAIFVVLDSYARRGVCTLAKMIDRYAPPCENHTLSYVDFVSQKSGVKPNVVITTTNRDIMVPVVSAMVTMENGTPPPANEINEGWELFIKHKP